MRVLAAAVMVSALLAIAGPRTRAAIATLHSEFSALDVLAITAVAAPARVQQQPHWVSISDYSAALAREQARQWATSVRP